MCLGIPGQLVEFVESNDHLARVDVSGVTRIINIGLLEDEDLKPGDWVLIHVGFAMSKISEADAKDQLRALEELGESEAVLEEVRGYELGEENHLLDENGTSIAAPATPAKSAAPAASNQPGGGE